MKLRTYRTFQAMILFGLGFFLLNRLFTGQLLVYIHQRYLWLVFPAAFGLLAMAYFLFNRRPLSQPIESGYLTEEEASPNAHWRLLFMLIPLFFGIVIPVSPLDAEAAASRRVQQSLTFSTNPDQSADILELAPETRSILEWLWIIDLSDDKSQLEGQPVDVEGFVLLDENLPEGQFLIARFVISCCVADAIPIGMPVDQGDIDEPVNEGWVRVRGYIETSQQTPGSVLIIASEITPIERPDQPYLYQ